MRSFTSAGWLPWHPSKRLLSDVEVGVSDRPYHLHVDIPGVTPLNSADSMHWSTRHRHRTLWHGLVAVYVPTRSRPKRELPHALVTITRNTARRADFDNLVSAVKFPLDALEELGIIVSDKPECIGRCSVRWKFAQLKKGFTTIDVLECGAEDLDLTPWLPQCRHRCVVEIGAFECHLSLGHDGMHAKGNTYWGDE